MMAEPKDPPQFPFDGSKIPPVLKAAKRWAPWQAVFDPKRGKYDKIPRRTDGYGLSTAKPELWYSYEDAEAAYLADPDTFAGVGYVLNAPHGVVGIDLDNCVDGNTIAPWALEIITQLDSYTEISPSGKGLRVWVTGSIARDWTNIKVGVEIYGGHNPRFLTVTGQRLKAYPTAVCEGKPDVLDALEAQYASAKVKNETLSLPLPDLLDDLLVPGLDGLGLRYKTREMLEEGKVEGDRSHLLFASAVDLYSAGLTDEEVFTILATNPHVMEIALGHRNQNVDRALEYLWVEHCLKARGRASSKVATAADFEDVSSAHTLGDPAPAGPETPKTIAPTLRFPFIQASAFSKREPMKWLIKKVLPQGEVGAIFGESGAGKSFFALDMVVAVASGTAWKGHKVDQGSVAYVCAEGAGGFALRLQACSEHTGVDLSLLPIHILGDTPSFLDKTDIKDLVASLRLLPGLKVIVVDTLAQVTAGGNENSGEDMGRALAHCKVLSAATKAMVLLVAHSGKDSTRGLRGWSGIKGALDVEILVERSGKYRSATVTKMKDGSGEGSEFSFELPTVVLGKDGDGDDITSCVIKHIDTIPKAERVVTPKGSNEKIVLRVAVDLTDLPGVVTTSALIEAAMNELAPPENGKRDQRRTVVTRAIESLVASNRLSLTGGEVVVL